MPALWYNNGRVFILMRNMSQSTIIAIFSFLVLVALAGLFLYLHLRGLREDAAAYWEQILDKLRIRNDMVPNLIETVHRYDQADEQLINGLIALRAKSWPIDAVNPAKVDAELTLTENLHLVWQLPQKKPELNHDTNFLSLKKDFSDLGKEIDAMTEEYNQKIRSYNKKVNLVLAKNLLFLLGLKALPVFEFEP